MDKSFDFEMYLFFFIFFTVITRSHEYDPCKATKCGDGGPEIRFPFRLKNRQPESCGHRGFTLSCTEQNDIVLDLSAATPAPAPVASPLYSAKLLIKEIDYGPRVIFVSYGSDDCFHPLLINFNFSGTPFRYADNQKENLYTLFKCPYSSTILRNLNFCYDKSDLHVYIIYTDDYDITEQRLSYCNKTASHIPLVQFEFTHKYYLALTWSQIPEPPRDKPKSGTTRTLKITGIVLGSLLIAMIAVVLYCIYSIDKTEREHRAKIEKFLEDYRALKPARYSYADIKRITQQFKDKLGKGGYGTVFKGKLSNEILVAVKILNVAKGNGDDFLNEVGTMGRIHHVNVVRLVGFCADGFRRALVYEFLPNESLEKFIFSEDLKKSLGWKKLKDIALGIAKGIEYLHQGCDQRILHFDIKPHNVLLDQNFNPKISDFGLAKLCSKEQSAISMTTNSPRGTVGYIAPEVFSRNFGNVSHKSDVYSFGMLLLDMVDQRRNINTTEDSSSQGYFPDWIYNRMECGEPIGSGIESGGDANIAKKLTIVGLWCIQWYPADRPSMKVVVQMLEGEGSGPIMPPNPFSSSNPTAANATKHRRTFDIELPIIHETV
ncbi:rust resistance kinase Lr10-like isoform X2 [Malania oleifera]|nr:rust resistance kinase Lr10-like isoform X2 [Malania oleifera]